MVTRLVARFRGGTRPPGSRGRGGTLTECLLGNLSLGWGWVVTEQREGEWELWREESVDVQEGKRITFMGELCKLSTVTLM